ncbi:translation initiation factor eIF-2 beta subunit [Exophiala xenobiotica]|uniref:Translation initiation factor eIF-2 beta subunit n=1 Tax=Lithohypha guttulata TaxID=1690604 RepID=A0ABR0KDW8_9EURO|nr:translation initiation factor eIF-2 beta subunit [Lithohypha guttulata]KAK5321054.1 translation initiation factor eIF-2 beta subunit [Exophiala xenobiotica]
MAEVEQPLPERKARKSVAFSEGATIMDENGNISESAQDGTKSTAEKHSSPSIDQGVEEVTKQMEGADMFAGMAKKKKKSKKTEDADGEAPAADGEFDPSSLKKKKKKSTKPKDDDFEAKLAKAGVEGAPEAENEQAVDQDGDWEKGTGIWSHDNKTPIAYPLLLDRFFELINHFNPDILSSGSRSYKIPPPQCLREGNKKTIFANIAEICKRMKRNDDHVIQFLFAELGTSGSVDGSKRLVIKGRFQQKQIENVLRRYIMEYVTCKTCRSPDTELSKGENRLYFVTCNSCGSRRSVQAIKSGFTAQVGKRKRMQG